MSRTLETLYTRFKQREAVGVLKYGTTVDRSDLSAEAWLAYLHEELMDGSIYLERLRGAMQLLEEARTIMAAGAEEWAREDWLERYRSQFGGGA